MYDEYCAGTPLGLIGEKVKENLSWNELGSPTAVLAAVKRFAEKHGLDLPRRNKRWGV
jgi:hypothetical protein